MVKKKLRAYIVKQPKLQYPYFWLTGVVNQFKYLFSARGIASSSKKPFLLIVGSGRSGNTLLRRLLMENGDIFIPPESYVLGQEVITHLNAYTLCWPDKVELTLAKIEFYPEFSTFEIDSLREFSVYAKKFSKERQQIGTLIIELYQWIAKKKGYSVTWVGDKTPLNTLNLGLVRSLFPQAVFIFIERDAVDVCYSYVQSGIYNSMEHAAYRWKDSRNVWQKFKKNLPKNSYIEIKYETLVNNHMHEIRSIFDKFEIPVYTEKKNTNNILGDVTLREHHSNVAKAPNRDSIGKGRMLLNEGDRKILQSIIGDEIEIAGYKPL